MLDLAKVAAGKTVITPVEFTVENLFGALRGMLRPLLVGDAVSLVFEDAAELPPLYTDEAKVSQIFRNFLSNAKIHGEGRGARVGRAGRRAEGQLTSPAPEPRRLDAADKEMVQDFVDRIRGQVLAEMAAESIAAAGAEET